jgi:ferredoxin
LHSEINEHQLSLILESLKHEYDVYGVQEKNGKTIFDLLDNFSNLELDSGKTILSFKKILLPPKMTKFNNRDKKIAFVGLNNCDAWALQSLLEEFEDTTLLPKKENIFVVTKSCTPDKNCFCGMMGTNALAPSDLHLQKSKNGYNVFAQSRQGKDILHKVGIKPSGKSTKIDKVMPEVDEIDRARLSRIINDKEGNQMFWKGIASNCFGCGACVAVCPLCFCTRSKYENTIEGESRECQRWDACFAKRFSEVQNRFDLRPENSDRLYNWYHHKFVRAYKENKKNLCTGCGRCIEACTADLNIKNILTALIYKNKPNENETK